MAMRRETGIQDDLVATWAEMPRSPGHAFYDRLQALLKEAGFDAFVRGSVQAVLCAEDGCAVIAARPLFPHAHGRLFRGYRQRARHLLALFGFAVASRVPAPGEPRQGCRSFLAVEDTLAPAARGSTKRFSCWVLSLVAERGLVKGERIGVDGSTMEANAALRTIVRRDSGETYRQMLTQMAKESGVETPTIDDLGPAGSQAEGQETLEQGLDEPDRSGCEDRADEGRRHASGLQA